LTQVNARAQAAGETTRATILGPAGLHPARITRRPMRHVEAPSALQAKRVVSVDALRGFNFIWILGGDGAMWALDQMTNDKGPVVSGVGHFLGLQLTHVPWEGLRFYDFVFPLFIFITGVAIVLSLPRLVEHEGLTQAHLRVLRRALTLYVLGLIYYGGVKGSFDEIRYLGVLQRIAICYLFASLMFLNFNLREMIIAFVALLVGYWALMTFVPVPGIGAGNFGPDQNLANWIDAHYLPGRLWDTSRDPEGMLSTLPAIGTCLLGVFAGLALRDIRLDPRQKSLWLIGGGIALVISGHLWALQFPIIKAIWTSSFVLVTGGYSAILLGVAHQVIDVWGYKKWATPLIWIGANAITLYIINSIVGFEPIATRLVGGDVGDFLDDMVTPGTGLFVANLVGLALVILLARFLYRRQIFLRV
jgi:predicted acyltransferase